MTQKLNKQSSLGNSLNNIGYTYQKLGQYSQALKYLEEALTIVQQTGDRRIAGNTLDSIGTVYKNKGKLPQALTLYQQALAIRKDIGDRPGERITLSNIGDVLVKQKQPQLAILFYKQSDIDEQFNKEETIYSLTNYSFVHLATHAFFAIGQPEDSFILLGDGDIITMPDIQTLLLRNVDLVVLSACNTGIGGINNGNGVEILGFGYQMQNAGTKAAIASLWSVSDGGTQILMNTFYALLHQGNISKAEALRQAQVIMITGDFKLIGSQQDRAILQSTRNNLSPNVVNNLSHPYYWAPFFLIGNGL